MHLVLVTGIPSYLKVHVYLPFSHLLFQSFLDPKGIWGRTHQCRYKLLGGKGLSLFFPIVSSTTDYMQYSPSKISVENNERIYEEGEEKRKDNALKGDKGTSTIFLRRSPWPGSHPILLFTPLPCASALLAMFFLPFGHEILWDTVHSPLRLEYPLPMSHLRISSRLQFYCTHLSLFSP